MCMTNKVHMHWEESWVYEELNAVYKRRDYIGFGMRCIWTRTAIWREVPVTESGWYLWKKETLWTNLRTLGIVDSMTMDQDVWWHEVLEKTTPPPAHTHISENLSSRSVVFRLHITIRFSHTLTQQTKLHLFSQTASLSRISSSYTMIISHHPQSCPHYPDYCIIGFPTPSTYPGSHQS